MIWRHLHVFVALLPLAVTQQTFLPLPTVSDEVKKSSEGDFNAASPFVRLWEYALKEDDTQSSTPVIRVNLEPKTLLLPKGTALINKVPQDAGDPLYGNSPDLRALRQEFLMDHLVLELVKPSDPQLDHGGGLRVITFSGKGLLINRNDKGNLLVGGVPVESVTSLRDGTQVYLLQDMLFDNSERIKEAVQIHIFKDELGGATGPPLDIPGDTAIGPPATPPPGVVGPPAIGGAPAAPGVRGEVSRPSVPVTHEKIKPPAIPSSVVGPPALPVLRGPISPPAPPPSAVVGPPALPVIRGAVSPPAPPLSAVAGPPALPVNRGAVGPPANPFLTGEIKPPALPPFGTHKKVVKPPARPPFQRGIESPEMPLLRNQLRVSVVPLSSGSIAIPSESQRTKRQLPQPSNTNIASMLPGNPADLTSSGSNLEDITLQAKKHLDNYFQRSETRILQLGGTAFGRSGQGNRPLDALTSIEQFAAVFELGDAPGDNIVKVLQREGLTTLLVLLETSGLLNPLLSGDNGPYIIVAPSETAFAKSTPGDLRRLARGGDLSYLLIPLRGQAAIQVTNGSSFPTMLGPEIKFNVYGDNVYINGVPVTRRDVPFTHGAIQVVEGVLMPPAGNLKDILGEGELSLSRFSTLTMVSTLSDEETYTILAPPDSALTSKGYSWPGMLLEPSQGRNLVQRHTLSGAWYTEGLLHQRTLNTLAGTTITFRREQDGTITANGVPLLASNRTATNGVIHLTADVIPEYDLGSDTTSVPNPLLGQTESPIMSSLLFGSDMALPVPSISGLYELPDHDPFFDFIQITKTESYSALGLRATTPAPEIPGQVTPVPVSPVPAAHTPTTNSPITPASLPSAVPPQDDIENPESVYNILPAFSDVQFANRVKGTSNIQAQNQASGGEISSAFQEHKDTSGLLDSPSIGFPDPSLSSFLKMLDETDERQSIIENLGIQENFGQQQFNFEDPLTNSDYLPDAITNDNVEILRTHNRKRENNVDFSTFKGDEINSQLPDQPLPATQCSELNGCGTQRNPPNTNTFSFGNVQKNTQAPSQSSQQPGFVQNSGSKSDVVILVDPERQLLHTSHLPPGSQNSNFNTLSVSTNSERNNREIVPETPVKPLSVSVGQQPLVQSTFSQQQPSLHTPHNNQQPLVQSSFSGQGLAAQSSFSNPQSSSQSSSLTPQQPIQSFAQNQQLSIGSNQQPLVQSSAISPQTSTQNLQNSHQSFGQNHPDSLRPSVQSSFSNGHLPTVPSTFNIHQSTDLANPGVFVVPDSVEAWPPAEEEESWPPTGPLKSEERTRLDVVDLLERLGLTKFLKLVRLSGLDLTLKLDGPWTIFAPSNAAVAAIPPDALQEMAAHPTFLRRLVSYHIAPGSLTSSTSFTHDGHLPTLHAGYTLPVSYYNHGPVARWVIGGSVLSHLDEVAANGVIHTVESVLYAPYGDVVQTVTLSPVLTIFAGVIQEDPSLLKFFSGPDPVTVFVPSDTALRDIRIPDDMSARRDWVLSHVVDGTWYTAGFANNWPLFGTNNHTLITAFTSNPDKITVNGVEVSYADITASNGVIHVIESPLYQPT